MNEIFSSLGVDYIIEGGQTMNPSTEDMLNAIDQINAFLLYTSGNLIKSFSPDSLGQLIS